MLVQWNMNSNSTGQDICTFTVDLTIESTTTRKYCLKKKNIYRDRDITFHCLAFSSSIMSAISGSTTPSGAFNCFGHWNLYQNRTNKVKRHNKHSRREEKKINKWKTNSLTVTRDFSSSYTASFGKDAWKMKPKRKMDHQKQNKHFQRNPDAQRM